jgi:Lon protease-like protein
VVSPSGLSEDDLVSMPVFPLPSAVLFPGALLPLHVFEPRYRELTRDALAGRKLIAIARLQPGFETDYDGRPPVFDVCGVGSIIDSVEHADGRFDITLRGLARTRILHELPPDRSYREMQLEELFDIPAEPSLTAAYQRKLVSVWTELGPHLPEHVRDLRTLTRGADSAGVNSALLAAALVGDPDGSQRLLAELDPAERLRLLTEKLQRVLDSIAPPSPSSRRSDLN